MSVKIARTGDYSLWAHTAVGAIRTAFGVAWATDAYLKWQPSFLDNYLGYITSIAQGQPKWLLPWFHLWAHVIRQDPNLFAWGTRLIETAIAIGLLFGLCHKWVYILGEVFTFLIWSIPEGFGGNRDLLEVMAFGVVLFTLLMQGTTMGLLIRRLQIVSRSEAQAEYEMRHARLASLRAADTRLEQLHGEGLISSHAWERLKPFIIRRATALAEAVRASMQADPALEAEELDTGWRELLRAQRGALLGLRRDGVISEDVFETLTAEIDAQLAEATPPLTGSNEGGTQFLEVTLTPEPRAGGKSVAELQLPRSAVIVSILRDQEVIIPRGDIRLQAGDVVTSLCTNETASTIRELLQSPAVPGNGQA